MPVPILAIGLITLLSIAASTFADNPPAPQSITVTSEGTHIDGNLNITGELLKNGVPLTPPPATTTTLGSVKVGAGLSVKPDGTLSASAGGGGNPFSAASIVEAEDAMEAEVLSLENPGILYLVPKTEASDGSVWFAGKLIIGERAQPTLVLLTPAMTSNTAPAPFVATASSKWSGPPNMIDDVWHAFDQKNTSTGGNANAQIGWQSADNKYTAPDYYGSEWIMIDLGSEKTLTNYNLRSRGYSPVSADHNQFPRDFTLSISTDGLTFVDVDAHTDVPQPTVWYQNYSFTLNSPVHARFVKITVTRSRTRYIDIGEIELYGYQNITH